MDSLRKAGFGKLIHPAGVVMVLFGISISSWMGLEIFGCPPIVFLISISCASCFRKFLEHYKRHKGYDHERICSQEYQGSSVFHSFPGEILDYREKFRVRRHSFPVQLSEKVNYTFLKLTETFDRNCTFYRENADSDFEKQEADRLKDVKPKKSEELRANLRKCVSEIEVAVGHLKSLAMKDDSDLERQSGVIRKLLSSAKCARKVQHSKPNVISIGDNEKLITYSRDTNRKSPELNLENDLGNPDDFAPVDSWDVTYENVLFPSELDGTLNQSGIGHGVDKVVVSSELIPGSSDFTPNNGYPTKFTSSGDPKRHFEKGSSTPLGNDSKLTPLQESDAATTENWDERDTSISGTSKNCTKGISHGVILNPGNLASSSDSFCLDDDKTTYASSESIFETGSTNFILCPLQVRDSVGASAGENETKRVDETSFHRESNRLTRSYSQLSDFVKGQPKTISGTLKTGETDDVKRSKHKTVSSFFLKVRNSFKFVNSLKHRSKEHKSKY